MVAATAVAEVAGEAVTIRAVLAVAAVPVAAVKDRAKPESASSRNLSFTEKGRIEKSIRLFSCLRFSKRNNLTYLICDHIFRP
jgi:hypothetical protein